MKVWPIDPLVPRNLRLEVPEKLPQGLAEVWIRYGRGLSRRATGSFREVTHSRFLTCKS